MEFQRGHIKTNRKAKQRKVKIMFNKKTLKNIIVPVDVKSTFWNCSFLGIQPDVRVSFRGDVRKMLEFQTLQQMYGLQSPCGSYIAQYRYNGTSNITDVDYVFSGMTDKIRAARFYKKTQRAIATHYRERTK